jgi:hypothetical protein
MSEKKRGKRWREAELALADAGVELAKVEGLLDAVVLGDEDHIEITLQFRDEPSLVRAREEVDKILARVPHDELNYADSGTDIENHPRFQEIWKAGNEVEAAVADTFPKLFTDVGILPAASEKSSYELRPEELVVEINVESPEMAEKLRPTVEEVLGDLPYQFRVHPGDGKSYIMQT